MSQTMLKKKLNDVENSLNGIVVDRLGHSTLKLLVLTPLFFLHSFLWTRVAVPTIQKGD